MCQTDDTIVPSIMYKHIVVRLSLVQSDEVFEPFVLMLSETPSYAAIGLWYIFKHKYYETLIHRLPNY